MAFTKYTGKAQVNVFDSLTILGVQTVTITQTFAPLAEQIDTTIAGDSNYAYTIDPLGGKGSPKCVVRVETLMSHSDRGDTPAGITAKTLGATAATYNIKPTAAGDEFTLTAMLRTRTVAPAVRTFVPITFTLESASSAGAWTTIA